MTTPAAMAHQGRSAAGSLAARLRSETRSLHSDVERAGMMPQMLSGRLDRLTYCHLLRNFHAIYQALESALDRHCGLVPVAAVWFAGLARTAALERDLLDLHGEWWLQELPVAEAGERYVRRLAELDQRDPLLLVAHAYVRYLGDLSGGQILRRIVAGALNPAAPDSAAGARFYLFPAPGAVELAQQFRAGLGAIVVDGDAASRIVAEAQAAFRLHGELFEQLADVNPAGGPALR